MSIPISDNRISLGDLIYPLAELNGSFGVELKPNSDYHLQSLYPYTEADYQSLRDRLAALNKPLITLSHYSFAGGNRAAPLFDRFLPLPAQERIHFYGHAHIGDAVWAGKDCYRKIAAVDNQPIIQVNVSSLENYRGSAIRSVILEWYETGEIGVCFRNHTRACWDDYLLVSPNDRVERNEE